METIKYTVGSKKKQHILNVADMLLKFNDSNEGKNHTAYYYSFRTCFRRFITEEIKGINKFSDGQFATLEKIFNELAS